MKKTKQKRTSNSRTRSKSSKARTNIEDKRLYTSSFDIAGKDGNAVAISIGVPKWYKGKRYLPLAPTWEMVMKHKKGKMSDAQYTKLYKRILDELDAHKVVKSFLNGSILLCWENPGDFCHRRIAADWIKKKTGLVVPELSDKRLEEFFDL